MVLETALHPGWVRGKTIDYEEGVYWSCHVSEAAISLLQLDATLFATRTG